ncbi:MAG: hypothetical protein Q8N37_03840 [bacterium]|nr:hypothetical protein [bacterium]
MSKTLKASLRKTLVGIVMMTTIFSLSGVTALIPVVQAATIVDGDVIRNPSATGDAQFDVYIVKLMGAKKFKRLVLNPQVFNSYGHLKWSNVKTVTTAEMSSYTTSATVRVETDPKVLALAPNGDAGSKSWLNVTAADYVAAGGDWDSVYVINAVDGANYTAAADLTTSAQVVTFLTTGVLPGGVVPPVAGAIGVSLAASNPASATFVRDTGNVVAQANANFLALNFTAPSSGAVTVNTLKVTRSGISADSDLGTVYLYDGNTQIAQHSSFSAKVITFNNANGLFTVAAGATKTINVKADISAGTLNVSSIVLGLSDASAVVSNASTVSGTFPVNGNPMAVTTVADLGYANISSFLTFPATSDPGVTAKELWRFNVQANDQDMVIEKIKMTVVGTVSASDLANFSLEANAVAIGSPVAAMSAGKEVVFDLSAAPYKITSGQTKTIVVKGDVVNGSGRAFKFTIRQVGDFIVKDNSYGVYVAPLVSGAAFSLIDADAAGDGTNINNGTLTVGIATDSPSGNVAPGATGVTLAKFTYKANGEDVKINTIRVNVNEETSDIPILNGKLYFNGSQIGTTDASVADEVTEAVTTTQIIAAGATATIEYRADMTTTGGTALVAGQTIVVSLIAGTTDASGQSSLANVATSAVTGRTITVATGILTVAKNLTVSDATAALPSGVKSATGVKIGSFVLTAGAGESASVSQIRLTDSVANLETTFPTSVAFVLGANTDLDTIATGKTSGTLAAATYNALVVGESYKAQTTGNTLPATIVVKTKIPATPAVTYDVTTAATTAGTATAGTLRSGAATDVDTLADTFQNLKLMQGATQVGSIISNLIDAAGSNYDFTPATAITIAKGTQVVFDVLADAKSNAITLSSNTDASGVILHTLTTATGVDTGNSANTTAGTTTLQNVYVAGVGTLATSVSSDSPVAAQVVMGATGVEIARFKLAETSASENLTITQIVVTDTTGSVGSLSNIRLMDGTTPIATVATLTSGGLATFPSLSVTVPKGGNKVLSIQADITGFPGATSASTHVLSIAGGAITGTGTSSGTTLATSVASTGTAGTATVYRTKLTVAFAADTPSGLALAPAAGQLVAKFVVSNSTNTGGFDATLKLLNVAATSSWTNTAATRNIKIYKTSISAPNLLGTSQDFTGAVYATTTIAEGAFTDVSISSGGSITLLVTSDNQDIATPPDSFTIGIGAAGVTWNDVSGDITSVDGLPLISKTLSQ